MLELRPVCENCNKSLPNDSTDARICTYECTFCADCVTTILHNVCPNCGGGFVSRPIRPKAQLLKHPATTKSLHKPVDMNHFQLLLKRYKEMLPENR